MTVTLLVYYQKSLEKLITSNTPISKKDVLDILLTRDAINKGLSEQVKPSSYTVLKIEELDKQLKQNAEKLIQYIDLAEHRNNFPQSPNAWWWYLDIYVEEEAIKSHPWNRLDWLYRIFRVVVWTGNLALLGTLASLFLSSGSGFWGAVTIVFPSLLSLLQAQSELTETGKKGFDKLLKRFKIGQHLHEEVKLGFTVLMTVFLSLIWWSLPSISNRAKLAGQNLQDQGKLASAEEKYLQAIKLDGDNLDARYKLATVYEELQDFNNAKKQYIIAAKGGFLDAYNNLAYWYIRENKNGEAIDLLNQGLQLLEEKEQNFEELTDEKKLNFQAQKYGIFKNLGWARFKQKRYDDSISSLLLAMAIAKNPEYQKYIRNPGAAFCIYSQVLLKTGKPFSEVKENWQQCRQLIESRLAAGEAINSEEDGWLYEAKQQLNK